MSQETRYRLQKYLSRAGVTSRRKAEELIRAGRVTVNGSVVRELGTSVRPGRSKVEVDGRPVFWSSERQYLILYKPTGCLTALSDPEGRRVVPDLLPKGLPRVFPVGRLDWDTEGVLILTNDGDFANMLSHPSNEVERVYAAKVKGELKDDSPAFQRLAGGIELEDGFARPKWVAVRSFTGKHTWIELGIHSGKNRIVRRMCEAMGHPVLRLRRVAFGPLSLEGMQPGDVRDLSQREVGQLYALVSEKKPPPLRSKPKSGRTKQVPGKRPQPRVVKGRDGGRPRKSSGSSAPRRGAKPQRKPKKGPKKPS